MFSAAFSATLKVKFRRYSGGKLASRTLTSNVAVADSGGAPSSMTLMPSVWSTFTKPCSPTWSTSTWPVAATIEKMASGLPDTIEYVSVSFESWSDTHALVGPPTLAPFNIPSAAPRIFDAGDHTGRSLMSFTLMTSCLVTEHGPTFAALPQPLDTKLEAAVSVTMMSTMNCCCRS